MEGDGFCVNSDAPVDIPVLAFPGITRSFRAVYRNYELSRRHACFAGDVLSTGRNPSLHWFSWPFSRPNGPAGKFVEWLLQVHCIVCRRPIGVDVQRVGIRHIMYINDASLFFSSHFCAHIAGSAPPDLAWQKTATYSISSVSGSR